MKFDYRTEYLFHPRNFTSVSFFSLLPSLVCPFNIRSQNFLALFLPDFTTLIFIKLHYTLDIKFEMSEIPNFDGGSVSKLVNYFEGRSQVQAGLGGRYYLNVGFSPTEIIKFGIVKDYSPNFTHHAIFTTKLKGAFRVDVST